jgi:hypothetical protein
MTMTADDIMEQIRALPERERLRLVERVVHEVVEQKPAAPTVAHTDALWADVSDEEYAEFEAALREARGLPLRSTE